MGLLRAIGVYVVCFSVYADLNKAFPVINECADEGGECVFLYQCSLNSRNINNPIQCENNKICCWNTAKKEQTTHHNDEYVSNQKTIHNHTRTSERLKVSYLRPEKTRRLTYTVPSTLKYTVNENEDNSIQNKIVNIQFLNSTVEKPVARNDRLNAYNENEDDIIVFPDKSDEDGFDNINYIKKLYQKYAIDFSKNNIRNDNEEMPDRRAKYIVGYRSSKHCKLYENYTMNDIPFAIPLLPSLFPVLMQRNHCSKPLPLIVGGTNATRGEFPHMAALGYDRGEWIDFLCGASLISERYVLTAAHCALTKWGPPIMVRLGTRNLITDEGQNMDVEHVIPHPGYREPSCYHDIALIKMVPGLKMGVSLRPACLPPPSTMAGNPGSYVTATGWGRVGYGLFSSPNLQKVSLKVIDRGSCEEMFLNGRKSERLPTGIHDSMLCAAGYIDYSHDTCQGDSGGPLQALTRHSKCMYEIVGITSFGKFCGTGLPAIYTRVSQYVSWIEDIVWPS